MKRNSLGRAAVARGHSQRVLTSIEADRENSHPFEKRVDQFLLRPAIVLKIAFLAETHEVIFPAT